MSETPCARRRVTRSSAWVYSARCRECPVLLLPDRAVCLPTFRHLLIVNTLPVHPPPLRTLRPIYPNLTESVGLQQNFRMLLAKRRGGCKGCGHCPRGSMFAHRSCFQRGTGAFSPLEFNPLVPVPVLITGNLVYTLTVFRTHPKPKIKQIRSEYDPKPIYKPI